MNGPKGHFLCETCGDRVHHGRTMLVGRRASGKPKMLCDRPSCRRRWLEQARNSGPEERLLTIQTIADDVAEKLLELSGRMNDLLDLAGKRGVA